MKARTRTTQDWQTEAIYKLLAKVYRQAIAEDTGLTQPQVKTIIDTFIDLGSISKIYKSRDFSQDADFTPPLYNIWTFAKKSNVAAKKCDTGTFP